jgi:hypothetical protein
VGRRITDGSKQIRIGLWTRSSASIDRHYGHLARDGREHAIQLLDALNEPGFEPWTPVDAAWTSNERSAVSAGNGNGG